MTPGPARPGSSGQPYVAVLLGTDRHPFHRLVEWAAALAAEEGAERDGAEQDGATWFIQHGYTPWPPADAPANLAGAEILGIGDLDAVLEQADVVITHGGPGLIMEARAARHTPIVLPRNPELGEHVDGHQQDFTARLAAEGAILHVSTLAQLRQAVQTVRRDGRPITGHSGTPHATVERFRELVDHTVAQPRTSVLRRLLSR